MTIAEMLRQEGMQAGLQRGRFEGRQEGKQEGIQAIALKLLKMGYSITKIAEITGLSLQEIHALKDTESQQIESA